MKKVTGFRLLLDILALNLDSKARENEFFTIILTGKTRNYFQCCITMKCSTAVGEELAGGWH